MRVMSTTLDADQDDRYTVVMDAIPGFAVKVQNDGGSSLYITGWDEQYETAILSLNGGVALRFDSVENAERDGVNRAITASAYLAIQMENERIAEAGPQDDGFYEDDSIERALWMMEDEAKADSLENFNRANAAKADAELAALPPARDIPDSAIPPEWRR